MADDADDGRVSVTLRMDAATWEAVRERLDALVMEHDLDSYVLRLPPEEVDYREPPARPIRIPRRMRR